MAHLKTITTEVEEAEVGEVATKAIITKIKTRT